MTDFERINAPRVQKILDTLELIAKSARSNRVEGSFDHAALLRPVLDVVADTGAGDVPMPAGEQEPTPKSAPINTRLDMALADAAREVPMKDLVRTIAVFLNRIDELDLDAAPKKGA